MVGAFWSLFDMASDASTFVFGGTLQGKSVVANIIIYL
jgi:hypothetical protein